MSFLLREARRCGLLLGARRNVYVKSLKWCMTGRQLSNKSSSWTQIDLDEALKDEQNKNHQRLVINVKELFGETSPNKNMDNIESLSINIANKSSDEVIHQRKIRNESASDTKNTKESVLSSGMKSHGKSQSANKIVNFSYPKVVIPTRCSTLPVKDLNFLKFVDDYTAFESNSGETTERRSEFTELFTEVADDMLSKEVQISLDEWDVAGKRLTEYDQDIIRIPNNISKHWPLRLMVHYSGKLLNSEKFKVVNSLWEFAQDFYENKPPPLLMATYMNILASCGQEIEMLEIYEKLNERTRGIPEISVYFQVVSALLCTSKWQDCQVLTEKMEKFYSNMKSMLDCWFLVAYGHLMHGNLKEYEQIMEKLTKAGYDPTDSKVVIQLLMKMDIESGLTFLQNCRRNLWLPGVDLTNGVLSVLERDKNHLWTVTPTKMDRSGQCRNCGTSLSRSKGLTQDQFGTLQSEALAALVDGKDIYLKSNPGERRAFLTFCKKYGPFDAVLDGLNLFYARTRHGKTNLGEVITLIKMKYPEKTNILIVMRRHLLKTLGIRMERDAPVTLHNAHVFPLRNESEDDPYLLMAALSSGPNCMVVSNDDFSDQSYTFGSSLRPLFLSWQRTSQIFFRKETSSINLQWPKEFEHSVQEHDNGIHLPFSISHSLAAKVRPPNSWLCFVKEPTS